MTLTMKFLITGVSSPVPRSPAIQLAAASSEKVGFQVKAAAFFLSYHLIVLILFSEVPIAPRT